MTNLELHPVETVAGPDPTDLAGVQILTARDVPLGGIRAMSVRRTLPQRARSFVGAWCFIDHYGPDDVVATGGMVVPPHPHTGLATVSWLFTGEVEHRDSLGSRQVVRPGELNLMTAGRGIAHSEYSTPATTVLHGVQLWVALPAAHRDVDPQFRHHVPDVVELTGARLRVLLGTLAGHTSPVPTWSPLVGAEIVLDPGATWTFDVDPGFEHAVLLDTGQVDVQSTAVEPAQLAYVPPGVDRLTLVAGPAGARVLLLGGRPLGEQVVMWWNFLGGSHEEVVAARDAWQRELAGDTSAPRFGAVADDPHAPLPAPVLPPLRLVPRR